MIRPRELHKPQQRRFSRSPDRSGFPLVPTHSGNPPPQATSFLPRSPLSSARVGNEGLPTRPILAGFERTRSPLGTFSSVGSANTSSRREEEFQQSQQGATTQLPRREVVPQIVLPAAPSNNILSWRSLHADAAACEEVKEQVATEADNQALRSENGALRNDNKYLAANTEQLRRTKHQLTERIGILEEKNRILARQVSEYRSIIEQTDGSVDVGGMEIRSLHQQLEVVLALKDSLYCENMELRQKHVVQPVGAGTCVVCLDNLANIVCLPCRHNAVCSFCSALSPMATCPMCREVIQDQMEIFLC